MIFHSYTYIFFFLPIVVAGYYLLRRTTWHNLFLLVASYVFYCYGNAWLLLYILFSSTLDYVLAPLIEKASGRHKKLALLSLSLIGNLGLLFTMKYSAWVLDTLEIFLGLTITLPTGINLYDIALPPGLSFYTFQSLSYTIDVYRGDRKSEESAIDFFTYVSLFPQLVAGPIERSTTLLPQLKKPRAFPSPAQIEKNLFHIFWGLFKKLVIADNLGSMVDIMAADPTLVPGSAILIPYAFGMQIYCDFSAYTDIARGSAGLLGINLSRNFLTPYFSDSPREFWRRWHITLSNWLRDYLYIPLGGSRKGHARTINNLLITMFLGGLWHGAGGFFILWGLYHGALLILYNLVPINRILKNQMGQAGHAIAIIINFHLITVGWFLFRSNPDLAMQLLTALPQFEMNTIFIEFVRTMIFFIVPVLVLDFVAWRKGTEFVEMYERLPVKVKVILWLIIYFGITILAKREGYAFIYFAF
jgi:alginate O-acetyltransferase complex protein AlgI